MKKEKIWRCDLKEPCIKFCESEHNKHQCGIYLKDRRKKMLDLYKGAFKASAKAESHLLYKLSVANVKAYNIKNKELIK